MVSGKSLSMRGTIIRFLTLDVQITHPLIPWVLVAVWALLLAAAFSSLRQQTISATVRWSWFVAILVLPIVGLFAYTIRCLVINDWSFLKPLMQSRSDSVKSVNRPGK